MTSKILKCCLLLSLTLLPSMGVWADSIQIPQAPLAFYLSQAEKTSDQKIVQNLLGRVAAEDALASTTSMSADEKHVRIWDGNVPDVDLQLPVLRLQFASVEKSKPDFSLDIEYRKDALFIKHSEPGDPKMSGGVLFPWDRGGTFQGHIPTRVAGGLSVFFAPDAEEYRAVHRPVLLCMAKPVRQIKSRGQLFYAGVNATLKSMSMDAVGEVKVSLLSGHGDGTLKAEYFVGDGIEPPYVTFDEAIAKDPELSLIYRPRKDKPSVLEALEKENGLLTGMVARTYFENAAGYQRTVDSYVFMHVSQVEIPSNFPFKRKGEELYYQNAPCWLLYSSRGTSSFYTHRDAS